MDVCALYISYFLIMMVLTDIACTNCTPFTESELFAIVKSLVLWS